MNLMLGSGGKVPTAGKRPRQFVKKSSAKKGRYRPGTVALREIRRHQEITDPLIEKRCFQALARSLSREVEASMRWQPQSLVALQEASESFIVGMLEASQLLAVHGRRITLMEKDVKMWTRLAAMFGSTTFMDQEKQVGGT